MNIKIRNELIPLNLLVFILVAAIILFPSNVLRVILGVPFLLFFPGYTLVAALFTRKGEMGAIERPALSLGMSIAVVPLIGLICNYTPWGVRLEPILYSVTAFIFVTSVIAWFRRQRLPEEARFGIKFHLAVPRWGGGIWERALSIILVVAILGTLGTIGYLIVIPKAEERFTEFYLLGLEGKAMDYPKELVVGEEARVIVGIINHENKETTYRVEVVIEGERSNEVEPIVLADEQKWEEMVSFTPSRAGQKQRVEFLLYKNGQTEPYLKPLFLWIDVTD